MKLGADNPKKVVITATLLVFALSFLVYTFDRESPEPASRSSMKQLQGVLKTGVNFDPSLRTGLLKSAEDTIYTGTGENIFVIRPDPPPPPTCAPLGGASGGLKWCEQIGPHPALPPPPIPLKFFGFASKPGEAKKAFLSQGDDIFVASEGDIVDRRYKIVRITSTFVEVQDMINNNAQPIRLNS